MLVLLLWDVEGIYPLLHPELTNSKLAVHFRIAPEECNKDTQILHIRPNCISFVDKMTKVRFIITVNGNASLATLYRCLISENYRNIYFSQI